MKIALIALSLISSLGTVSAYAQMSTSGDYPVRKQGTSQDPTDAAVRRQTHTLGKSPDEWARHLDDPDPAARLAAIKLIGESGDPRSNQHLISAVDNTDPRVATLAVDYIGKLGSKDASEVLSEKLFVAGTNPGFRQHVLAALGRIRDPASARRVLAFAQGESDPGLRAAAIRAMGDIGDDSVSGDLERLSESEADPTMKTLLQDTVARISVHGSTTHGEARSSTGFSHSEGKP